MTKTSHETPQKPNPAVAGSAASTAANSPAPEPAQRTPDKHAGTGGHYKRVNGQRVLVSRTQAEAPADKA